MVLPKFTHDDLFTSTGHFKMHTSIHLVQITKQPYIKPHINSVICYIILMYLQNYKPQIKDKIT
jgi:hypothetical protein